MIQFPSRDPASQEYVEACLLLSLAERPAYGYELTRALDDLGIEVADRGRIYRALRSMEERGLVTSHWDTTTSRGPARRTYDVTALGHDRLDMQVGAVRRRRRQLNRFLARYERIGAGRSGAVA